jgi:hypothetical protein
MLRNLLEDAADPCRHGMRLYGQYRSSDAAKSILCCTNLSGYQAVEILNAASEMIFHLRCCPSCARWKFAPSFVKGNTAELGSERHEGLHLCPAMLPSSPRCQGRSEYNISTQIPGNHTTTAVPAGGTARRVTCYSRFNVHGDPARVLHLSLPRDIRRTRGDIKRGGDDDDDDTMAASKEQDADPTVSPPPWPSTRRCKAPSSSPS